jgi:hypothetical protein
MIRRWAAIVLIVGGGIALAMATIVSLGARDPQRTAATVANPGAGEKALPDALHTVLAEWEVVRHVLTADVNGDGRAETLVFIHDYSEGYPPDLVLYVLTPRRGREAGMAVVRTVGLGKPLMLDAEVAPEVRDFVGLGLPQLVVHGGVGDHTQLIVLTLKGKDFAPHILYDEPIQGSAEILPRHEKQPARIVEHWTVWNLMGDDAPKRFTGHVLARRIYDWDDARDSFVLKVTEPDTEEERRLSPEDLRRVPGADVLLIAM